MGWKDMADRGTLHDTDFVYRPQAESRKDAEVKARREAVDEPNSEAEAKAKKGKDRFDVFISHCTKDDSLDVFQVMEAFLEAQGKQVFNPTTDLCHVKEINMAAMQDMVKRSNLVIAA